MNMRAYPHDEFQRLAVSTSAAALAHVLSVHTKKASGEKLSGGSQKGGDLLSHIVVQYHRRARA